MRIALLVAGWLLIVATVIPLIRTEVWWIRVFDFPRAQICIVGAVVLLAGFVMRDRLDTVEVVSLVALIAALAWQSYMMYAYLPFARKQVQPSRNPRRESSLRLLTSNVLMTNRGAEPLRQMIRDADPDVVLAVETDTWWQEQLRELETSHPYTVHQPQANTYGMLLYSRLELIAAEVKFLVQHDIPSIHARVKLICGQEVALHCLHPRPPAPTESDSSAPRDAELLLLGKSLKKSTLPVVVMGDLNDVAWSRTNYLFQDVSGLLDPRIGRGFFNTFHAGWAFMRFPLDHFFHSKDFRLTAFRRLGYFGSDHFPVFIDLSYEPDAAAEQPQLQASPDKQQEADEKIAEARRSRAG